MLSYGGRLMEEGLPKIPFPYPSGDDASVVAHMSHVVEVDSSVASLASLEVGHLAFRAGAGQAWSVEPHVWPDEDEAERQA